jgi:cytochrome c-type biogenesis protein
MLAALAEAIRATTQPCTLLLLLPAIVIAIVTNGRFPALAAICVGAVFGGWLFIANVLALDGWHLQLSGTFVVALITIALAAPSVSRLNVATPGIHVAAAGVVTFVATQWWRPCIGEELGAILTGARTGVPGELPGMAAYMLGSMAPVLAIVFVMRAIDPSATATRRIGRAAGGVGLVVAAAMAVGRHDELVTALTRWTTS